MTANDATGKKRIVDQLDFGSKTARRVTWEAFEFAVAGPHRVEVTNASYGFKKDDHAYVVSVDERDGIVVPAECECPADLHREPDCKHKVALATVGGSTVLEAAVAYERPAPASSDNPTQCATTAAEMLQPDGGMVVVEAPVDEADICPNDEEWCPGPNTDKLPCFDCFEVADEQGDNR
jgi:hypothetical protein